MVASEPALSTCSVKIWYPAPQGVSAAPHAQLLGTAKLPRMNEVLSIFLKSLNLEILKKTFVSLKKVRSEILALNLEYFRSNLELKEPSEMLVFLNTFEFMDSTLDFWVIWFLFFYFLFLDIFQ